jgi:hypothetical protein
MFLFTPSFAARLYLMVTRFMASQYHQVFRLADSCVSDTTLSSEEAQIWGLLEFLGFDDAPDAHSCRLKLTLATIGVQSVMPLPWNVEYELGQYIENKPNVSAECRLTMHEETQLLDLYCNGQRQSYQMRNYRKFLSFAHKMPLSAEQVEVEVTCPVYPTYGHFDSIEDKTALQKAPSDRSISYFASRNFHPTFFCQNASPPFSPKMPLHFTNVTFCFYGLCFLSTVGSSLSKPCRTTVRQTSMTSSRWTSYATG